MSYVLIVTESALGGGAVATPPQGNFYATPGFQLYRRGLVVQTVKRFRGLNNYIPLTQTTPDIAIDLLNVIVSSSGQLSKLRLPINLSPVVGANTGPFSFWDFQQAIGTRQVLSHFGSKFYYFTNDLANATLIEDNALNTAAWSFVEANNILFGANGSRMQKWTGSQWQQWGIVAPTAAPGFATVALPGGTPIVSIQGSSSTNTIAVVVNGPFNIAVGQNAVIGGTANYNGTYAVAQVFSLAGGQVEVFLTAAAPSNAIENAGTITPGAPNLLTGWSYGYAYKNSVTGHMSNISPTTPIFKPTGTIGQQLTAIAPTDTQVDTLVWFRDLDGGGDYFRLVEVNLATGALTLPNSGVNVASVASAGKFIILNDYDTTDGSLDQTIRGPHINNPPPQGTYTALAQGRIFVAGLVGAGADVVYSGYEQIVVGRPEESFPPNNRLHISAGAEAIAGLGPLHQGMVMYSNTGRMWMLRGAIEDITLNAPVAFSDVFEELPWTLGCLSHYTIAQTPYGLVWLAGDKTVQFWDGRSQPLDISAAVYPLLRNITPGTELLANGTYFNWLERDWYALTCATNGSLTPNTIIFWALDSQSQNIEVFVSNLTTNWLGVVSTSKLQRKLLMANAGRIAELPVRAVDANGLVNDFVTYPPTNGNLPAYWRSGYFGNDSPEQSKLFRWTRLIPDRGAASYEIQSRYVDDTNTIDAPRIAGPVAANPQRTPLNQRGFRASIEIDFPQKDVSCNVLELQLSFIGTSQR
jgi:hypothetical protein